MSLQPQVLPPGSSLGAHLAPERGVTGYQHGFPHKILDADHSTFHQHGDLRATLRQAKAISAGLRPIIPAQTSTQFGSRLRDNGSLRVSGPLVTFLTASQFVFLPQPPHFATMIRYDPSAFRRFFSLGIATFSVCRIEFAPQVSRSLALPRRQQ